MKIILGACIFLISVVAAANFVKDRGGGVASGAKPQSCRDLANQFEQLWESPLAACETQKATTGSEGCGSFGCPQKSSCWEQIRFEKKLNLKILCRKIENADCSEIKAGPICVDIDEASPPKEVQNKGDTGVIR